jgi:hypothetical protein
MTPEDIENERMLRVIRAPVTPGGALRAGLGVAGAPGAVAGAATEAATGRPGLGTAAEVGTNVLTAGGVTRAGARRLLSPAVPARRLTALGEEAAPTAARAARRISRGTAAAPAGVSDAGALLTKAVRATDPVQQGRLVTRAATLLEKAGRSPETVRKLQRLGRDIQKAQTSLERRRIIQKVARLGGPALGTGGLFEVGRRGVGRGWEATQR